MEKIKKIPKNYIFLILAVISALLYPFSKILFIITGLSAVIFTINKPYNLFFALVFIVIHLTINSYFIVVDTVEYEKINSVQFGSGKCYINKNIKIFPGNILFGNFYIDKEKSKPFFKPVYIYDGKLSVFQAPVISKILQFRSDMSNYLFYSSGGKITVAQALILGDKKFISDNLKDAYTISGLFHLLSMSGSHVAIVTAIFLSVLFFLPLKIRFIAASFGALFLIMLGGFNITVIRASIFAAIIMMAYVFDLKVNSKKFILFIAGLFLLVSPASINNISFLMSFGAVFGIIYMMKSGYGIIKTAIITGTAATLITAPLSMYVFGTTNHLSILSTMIVSPVIYLHILFAIFALIAPNTAAAPLLIIENISNNMVYFIAKITYFSFIFKTIPFYIMAFTIFFTVWTLFMTGRKKILSLLSLLIIFYPAEKPPKYIFPEISPQDKGFIVFSNNKKEIFYQGSEAGFRYNFMPTAAKYGVKVFDYGSITVFGGKNNYIKIKNIGKDNFTNLCLNEYNKKCSYFYHTRSNSIKNNDIHDNITHIIWKNNISDKSIIEISKYGSFYVK